MANTIIGDERDGAMTGECNLCWLGHAIIYAPRRAGPIEGSWSDLHIL